jgi:hypothetical protein
MRFQCHPTIAITLPANHQPKAVSTPAVVMTSNPCKTAPSANISTKNHPARFCELVSMSDPLA